MKNTEIKSYSGLQMFRYFWIPVFLIFLFFSTSENGQNNGIPNSKSNSTIVKAQNFSLLNYSGLEESEEVDYLSNAHFQRLYHAQGRYSLLVVFSPELNIQKKNPINITFFDLPPPVKS